MLDPGVTDTVLSLLIEPAGIYVYISPAVPEYSVASSIKEPPDDLIIKS